MNVIKHFHTLAGALLAVAGLSCVAAEVPADPDPVGQFVRKELRLDPSRFFLGAAKTNFPGLRPDAAGEETSGWQRLEIAAGPLSSAINLFDLRFDGERLVELRMMVAGSMTLTTATNDNIRLLAEFRKLGAKRRKGNPHRFDLETKDWRVSAEGFCSDESPGLVQFHVTPPPPRRDLP